MPLPEIPESWFRLIQLIVMSGLTILGVLGYRAADKALDKATTVEAGQVVSHEKQDRMLAHQETNSAKIDAAKTAADTAKDVAVTSVAKTDAKLDALDKKVTSLPPVVAAEVKKDK